jgi:hypothetical protein
MKNNRAIKRRPALILASLRAIESYQPEQERLFDDRFSRALLPGLWKVCLLPGFRQDLCINFTKAPCPGKGV